MNFDDAKKRAQQATAGIVAAGTLFAGHEVNAQAFKINVHVEPIVIPTPEVQAHFRFQATTAAGPAGFAPGAIMVPAEAPRLVDAPNGKFYESDTTVAGPGGIAVIQQNYFLIAANGGVGGKVLQNDLVAGPNGAPVTVRRNWTDPGTLAIYKRDIMDPTGTRVVEQDLFGPKGSARALLGADGKTVEQYLTYDLTGKLFSANGMQPGEVIPPAPSQGDPLIINVPASPYPSNVLYYQEGGQYLPLAADVQVAPDRCFTRNASGGFAEFSAGAAMGFSFNGGFVVAAPPAPGVVVDVHLGDFFAHHANERQENIRIVTEHRQQHPDNTPHDAPPPPEKKHGLLDGITGGIKTGFDKTRKGIETGANRTGEGIKAHLPTPRVNNGTNAPDSKLPPR